MSFLNVTLEQMLLSLLFLMAHLGYLTSSFFRSKIKSEQRTKIDIKAYTYNCPCSGHSRRWFVVGRGGTIWFVSHRRVLPVALRSVTAPSAFCRPQSLEISEQRRIIFRWKESNRNYFAIQPVTQPLHRLHYLGYTYFYTSLTA